MKPSHTQWLIPFAVQLIPGGILFLGLFYIKESPRWLMMRGHRKQALRNLNWLRRLESSHSYIIEEVSAIDSSLEEQRTTVGLGFWQPFKTIFQDKRVLYRVLLGGSLFFWQNGTGINAINYYSPTVFSYIGITGVNTSLFTTGIFGLIKFLITFAWLFILIDKVGRRKLFMIGAFGGSLSLWYVGGYIAVADPIAHPSATLSRGGISAMAFFYIWTAFYAPSWNGTPWVVNSEIYPQHIRNLGQTFASSNNWFWNFLVVRFTPQMLKSMGYGAWFFFASFMALSGVFVFFLLPETKGIPLEYMERLFDPTLAPRKAHSIVMAELQGNEEAVNQALDPLDAEKAAVEHVSEK